MAEATPAGWKTGATFEEIVGGVARARYAIRKVLRIADEQARDAGIDPLHHQALIQIIGAGGGQPVHVTELAERLDVPAPLASRIVTALEGRGLTHRQRSTRDLRMIEVHITPAGRDLIEEIAKKIEDELGVFARRLPHADKLAAMRILAVYVGLRVDGTTIIDPNA